MLYILYGKDSFRLRERLNELRASLDSDGSLATSTVVLDGRKATPAEVMAACDTVPFLSAARLVIVEGALSGGAGAGRKTRKATKGEAGWLALAEYVERMPPSTHLVLLDGDVTGSSALLQALRGKGEVVEFRELVQRDVQDWLTSRAKAIGLDLSTGAARLLADFIGKDLWTLSGELEKLLVYSGGRTVTEDDVRSLVSAVREASVFALVDAIVEGPAARAVKLLRETLRAETESSGRIIAMVERQLRLLAIAREMIDARAGGAAIGRELGLNGYPLERLLEQAGGYPAGRVREAFRRLLEADLQIKRGTFDGELALELLANDLAEPATMRG